MTEHHDEVGLELVLDDVHRFGGIGAVDIDQVDQHPAALDMAEEAVAEPGALVRALDQAGNVGQHELAPVHRHHAEAGVKRRERIVGDLRLGRAHRRGAGGRGAGAGRAVAGVGLVERAAACRRAPCSSRK